MDEVGHSVPSWWWQLQTPVSDGAVEGERGGVASGGLPILVALWGVNLHPLCCQVVASCQVIPASLFRGGLGFSLGLEIAQNLVLAVQPLPGLLSLGFFLQNFSFFFSSFSLM